MNLVLALFFVITGSAAGNLSLVPTTEILNYTSKMLSESQVKLCRNTLKMPAMILDEEEKAGSRLISRNGLVEDPCAVEKERTMINPWTAEEKEIFMDKLAIFGKDFKKIASFLDHKTTADCVEFYYKNHKSDCFEKTKKKPELRKQGKSLSASTYLVTSGKKWNREMNAASLDMLGAASVMAAHAGDSIGNLATCPRKLLLGAYHDSRTPNGDSGVLERSSSYDIIRNERETVAADVLAGICGSLSSEAMGSCITSSVDPGEGYRELKCQRMGYGVKRPWTPEVTQNIDEETCSDESCGGEMDPADWTDEEKCMFMQAVSSYGKDFAMISRCVRTRSRDQCKVFFSKARKCLGLDLIRPGPNACTPDSDDANGGGSDTEDACVVEAGSVICSNKSVSKMEEDSMLSVVNMNPDESSGVKNLQNNLNRSEENNGIGQVDNRDDDIVTNLVSEDSHQLEKTEQVFGDCNSLNGVDRESLILHVEKNGPCAKIKMELDQESVFDVVEVINPADRSNSVSPAEDCTEGREAVLPEEEASLDDVRREEDNGADTNGQMPSKCTVKASSDCCPARPNCQQQEDCVELDSEKKQPGVVVISLLHESSSSHMAKDSVSKSSSAIQYEKTLDQGKPLSTLDDLKETDDDDDKQKSSVVDLQRGQNVVINAAESAQKLGVVYPLQNHPKKEDRDRDRDDDLSCKNPSSAERLSKLDRYIQSSHSVAQDFYLRKCNGLRPHSSGTGTGTEVLPLISQKNLEQSSNQTRAHSRSLSDTEKPSRSGDFKLFGKILSHPSSLQKPNENDDKGAHHHHPKLSSRSSVNMKFTPHHIHNHNHNHNIDGSLSVAASKVDRNINYLSLENLPMSYGFWDGNRLQTSFSSLPDSAILLAKYPAAFSNYPMSSTTPAATAKAKTEQTVVKSSSSSNERNLSGGMSVFPTREMNNSSSNGMIADYHHHHQVFRARDCTKLQPFTVDMKQQQQQQDLLFSEMQRRNGFEAVSSLQAPGRRGGMVGMNVVGGGGGGVLVGGACTPSVSDPVAAIKMHYAKAATDQFGQGGGGGGSIISRDDDCWRGGGGNGGGGGDIGSR